MHGLGISRRIQQITGGTFVVKPGSLFPALHRMEEEGWTSSFWGDSENHRRAKYYRLTKAGRKQLEAESRRWGRISWAIASLVSALLLQRLPYAHPERMGTISTRIARSSEASDKRNNVNDEQRELL